MTHHDLCKVSSGELIAADAGPPADGVRLSALLRTKSILVKVDAMAQKSAAVVGGGIMGAGIAQVLARSGYEVSVR